MTAEPTQHKGGQQKRGRPDTGMMVIIIYKLFKAIVLILVGVGALSLLHKDVAESITSWIVRFRLDPDNDRIDRVISAVSGASDRDLKLVGAGTFVYAGLFLTEGIGLYLKKRWAEWFTIVVTASFIPFEIFELTKRFTGGRLVTLIGNVAVLVYLILRLMHDRKKK